MKISYQTVGMYALRQMNRHEQKMTDVMERLASGQRVNHVKDDIAAFGVNQKLIRDLSGYNESLKHIRKGQERANDIEKAMNRMDEIFDELGELILDRDNVATPTDEVVKILDRMDGLITELKTLRVAETDDGYQLFDNSFYITTGAQGEQQIKLTLTEDFQTFNQWSTTTLSTQTIQGTRKLLTQERGKLNAFQSRLTYNENYTETRIKNIQAAEARIQNIDDAKESTTLAKYDVLQQSAQAMLAHANDSSYWVVDLLNQSV